MTDAEIFTQARTIIANIQTILSVGSDNAADALRHMDFAPAPCAAAEMMLKEAGASDALAILPKLFNRAYRATATDAALRNAYHSARAV